MEAAHAQLRPDAPRYVRHRPETTLLYQLVERHYPAFVAALGTRGRALPAYVHDEFEAYLKCGRLEAVTLIQRFGSALNLNIHFHLLVLDGVYELTTAGPRFRRVAPPTAAELEVLLGEIVTRIARHLERRGLLMREAENSYLSAGPGEEDGLAAVVGHSITYRIAVGPNEGRKAFTLQTVPPALEAPAGDERLAKHSGFSLHAGVAAAARQRDKVERLCRYIARPAVATGRLSLTAQGLVRYTLKTPYRDGTTHVIFEPLDFIARLVALVPKPRVHLTRYHGVLAPHSALRAEVAPAGRGKRIGASERSPAEQHRAMSWAKRLKRMFRIDIESCERCGGKVRIIASVEDPMVIGKILAHLEQTERRRAAPADADTARKLPRQAHRLNLDSRPVVDLGK